MSITPRLNQDCVTLTYNNHKKKPFKLWADTTSHLLNSTGLPLKILGGK
jgi:hypothetical protein